ncbi:MAG TPA: HAMP domain-containing sensor histidine kinase [Streptosporangiaceae bacterium]|nr:HAMP domain-containing sensor histidine kinase [Streptosporangiaceae bacterium]
MFGLAHWWWRRSLRFRLTLTAALGLAVALAGLAVLLMTSLTLTLNHAMDSSARQTGQEVAALVDANRLPNPVPVAAGIAVVQVVNAQGRIVAASAGADRLVPLLPRTQAATLGHSRAGALLDGRPYGLPETLRVVAVPGKRGETVIAAVSDDAVHDTLTTVAHVLAVGTPLLLLLMIWVSWLITGSTLRPITALRRGAEQVTAAGGPQGLPVPEARDEVHSLAVTLNDMLSRLAAAQQRQRQFVSDTAHELRSPIASMRTQLEVALDHPDSQEWRETARDVLADTLRLSQLAEDLLALARLEEGGGQARGGGNPVDLAALVHGIPCGYGQAKVAVVADAPAPCPVSGDAEALRRMLVNLVDNAVRYARSRVTVAAHPAGDAVLVTVTDDGQGIPAVQAERAFERFTTLDDARARPDDDVSGAGLGLAIVRATAHAHGGRVWLEDAGPGLRAAIRLPAAPGGDYPV